ncbi:MAG: radical SAM protein [Candidatus Omnitrophica bacterium]|nr:radical SAM protein [Candidatus Omnitrophota bacterium]
MKILFIRHHSLRSDNSGMYPHVSNVYPPLGLAYIATNLKQHNPNDIIKILDSKGRNLNLNQTIAEIKSFNPDIIAITALTETLPGVIEIGEACKELFPDRLRIIGGPHITVDSETVIKLGLFQLGVIGEGEFTFLEIVDEYKKIGKIPEDIKGTIRYTDEEIKKNELRPRIEDLDLLPLPDRSFFANEIYGPYLARKPWTYVTVSRGCPFGCAFCMKGVWGSKTTFNSGRRVFEEMKNCVEEFKIREIWFRDDTFTLRRKDVLELCELIIKDKLKVRWTMFTRVDRIDEEMIIVLKKAGCYKVDFGVESGDQAILDLMKKGTTIEQIKNAFAICRKVGMQTHGFFMIGYPRETKETIQRTIGLAREIADWASFNSVSVYPNTELYDLAVREGYFAPRTVDGIKGQSVLENFCNSDELPTEEILRLTNLAYKKFYLRPGHIIRLFIFMIQDGTFWKFIRITPYVLKTIFGKYQRVKR